MKILVCDADPQEVRRIRLGLERLGHGVFSAYDGGEALRQVHAHWPDLVLLDASCGYAMIPSICELPWHEPTYVVAVVPPNDDKAVVEAYHGGGDCHFDRPLDLAELRALLRS